MNDLRQSILSEIKRLASVANGVPPGQQKFEGETGIIPSRWRGVYWARWGDALVEAGFEPNEWNAKKDTTALLRKFAEITVANGGIPTRSELELMRRNDCTVPSPKHIVGHFGGKVGLTKALIELAENDKHFASISTLVKVAEPSKRATVKELMPIDGWVYLIKSGENFKIGRSDNLERRVKQISVVLPESINLYHAIQTDDPVGIEKYWHKRFADRRLNGEWFKLTKSDIAAFKRRKFQ